MEASNLAARCRLERLDGEIIDLAHPDYDRYRAVWNGMIDRRPGVIVRPRSAEAVRRAVAVAAEGGSLLAVRGGGHNVAGLSTCEGGMLLDLGLLRQVEVDPETMTACVAGGALLADLDRAGQPFGLVTPAGVISHTGVGGLTLGGGMGWLSRRFGMTVDNLLGVELVTADGRLVQASEYEEPDVFWAIRGGGGNFGVVTRFRFKMRELASVVVAQWRFARDDAATVLHAVGDLAPRQPRELTFGLNLTWAGLAVTACWSGAPSGAEAALAALAGLPRPMASEIATLPFVEHQRRHDDLVAWGRRYYTKGGYFNALNGTAISRLLAASDDLPGPDAEIFLMQLGGAVADVDDATTAFTGRDAGFFWLVQPIWDEAAGDEANLGWGRRAAALLTECSAAGNYVNEQFELDGGGVRSVYGEVKHARLARIKARYDPDNLFRLNQNIRPQA